MFGIATIIQKISDVMKKLDLMSGTLYNVEGIVKKIHANVKLLLTKIDKIEAPDRSDFYFSKFQIDRTTIEGRLEKINMNEFQQVVGTFAAKKKDGSPAKVQNPRVETDHPELVTAELSGESEVTVRAVQGAVQEATAILVTVTADADLGEGVREINVVGTIPLTPGEAESLDLTFGEPTDVQ